MFSTNGTLYLGSTPLRRQGFDATEQKNFLLRHLGLTLPLSSALYFALT